MGHEAVGVIVESRCPGWEEGALVALQDYNYNGFVEFAVAVPEGMARIPENTPDPGGFVLAQPLATVLRGMRRLGSVINEDCAVVGQGPIGLMFTRLLRRMGAARVIAIDRVPWRLEWSQRLGATDVVDASSLDPVRAVEEVTDGRKVDVSVEAGSTDEALITAAYLPRHGGRLCPFGVPHDDLSAFPWFHTTGNETEIIVSRARSWCEYFQMAADMIANVDPQLAELVTPRMPWEQAAEAFEMYAEPAKAEGSLKLALVL
jgi:threonine dehydrogenase-like Zn-dependent dehydrogenase